MQHSYTIAGLYFSKIVLKQINETPISIDTIIESQDITIKKFFGLRPPLVQIHPKSQKKNNATFFVTIFFYTPIKLRDVPEVKIINSFFPVGKDELLKKIFIEYDGIFLLNTDIGSEDELISSRSFKVIYDANENQKKVNAYTLDFSYTITNPNMSSAETIVIRDINIDPKLSRGTVSTSSSPELSG